MGGKKTEGNEQMKRAAGRKAKARGKLPSEMQATTGAPRQRKHLRHKIDHEERLSALHRYQQSAGWRPGPDGR
jgi:hypothetical protein